MERQRERLKEESGRLKFKQTQKEGREGKPAEREFQVQADPDDKGERTRERERERNPTLTSYVTPLFLSLNIDC